MSEEKKEFISHEDQLILLQMRAKASLALAIAEKVQSQYRLAEIEYKNVILNLFVKYKMGPEDRIDEASGEISRAMPECPEPMAESTNEKVKEKRKS